MIKSTIGLQGFIATVSAPLSEQQSLDLNQIEGYYRFLKNKGVNGVLIASGFEDELLSVDEKLSLMRAWKDASGNDKDFSVLQYVCENVMDYAAEIIRYASEIEITGVVLGFRPELKFDSVDQLVEMCHKIFEHEEEISFYFNYLNPQNSMDGNFDIVELIETMEKKVPNFCGVRFKGHGLQDFHVCKKYKNGKFDAIWDADEVFLPALCLGIKVATGTLFNFQAPLYQKIIEAYKNGDHLGAIGLEGQITDFLRVFKRFGSSSAKAGLMLMGLDCGPLKFPFKVMPANRFREFWSELDGLNFFSSSETLKSRGRASKQKNNTIQ